MFADGADAIHMRAKSVDSMDVTKALEDDPVSPVVVSASAEVRSEARSSKRPDWLVPATIYAFSVSLGLLTLLLCFKGPLDGAGPLRLLFPQPAMFAIVCLLWAAAVWAPVSLHYRGNTYLFVLEEVPLLIGLVFLSPNVLVLSAVLRRRVRLRRPPPAAAAESHVQRDLGRIAGCHRRHRLPRTPGVAQPGQPRAAGWPQRRP